MKTLYISYFGALKPLVQTQVVPYLRHLAAAGVDVTLVTFEERLDDPAEERRQREALAPVLAAAGIDWRPLRYHKRPSLAATGYDVAVGIAVGAALILRKRIDVVHARNHIPALMGLALKALLGTRLVFDLRGIMAEEYVDAGIWRPGSLPVRLIKQVERLALDHADAAVMLTRKIHEILAAGHPRIRTGELPVEIIPCCVEVEAYRQAASEQAGAAVRRRLGLEGKTVMTYVGSLGGWYMTDEMARLFAVGRARQEELHFLVITQSDPEIARASLSQAGVPAFAYTITRATPREIPAYLAASDFGLSFIRPTYSKLSSSPTKLGEYLAAGLPVLSNTGIGDVDELIRDERVGVLVPAFDDAHYARAIEEMSAFLADPEHRRRCRHAAARRLAMETVGRRGYLRVYQHLGLAVSPPVAATDDATALGPSAMGSG